MGATMATIALMYAAMQEHGALIFELNIEELFLGIGVFMALINPIIGALMFKKLTGRIKETDSPILKMNEFYSASLISWALLEGAIVANAVFMLLNGNSVHLAVIGYLMFIFITRVPSKVKSAAAMKLSEEEMRML